MSITLEYVDTNYESSSFSFYATFATTQNVTDISIVGILSTHNVKKNELNRKNHKMLFYLWFQIFRRSIKSFYFCQFNFQNIDLFPVVDKLYYIFCLDANIIYLKKESKFLDIQ